MKMPKPSWGLFSDIVLLVAILVVGVMFFDRRSPIKITYEYSSTNMVEAGQDAIFTYGIMSHKACETKVQSSIIYASGIEEFYEPQVVLKPGPTGVRQRIVRRRISRLQTPGEAIYRTHLLFVCNPMHRLWPVKYDAPEVKFEVVSSEQNR